MTQNTPSSIPATTATAIPEPASPGKRLDQVLQAHPWMRPEAINSITHRIFLSNASFRSRYARLLALADDVNQALYPITACRRGCSYCCSMETLIYRFEAVALAKASEQEMVELPYRPFNEVIAREPLMPQVCPFLVAGRCSVYDQRPMICRMHHSLNDAPEDCDMSVPNGSRPVIATYNPDWVEMPYHHLVRSTLRREPWGAITEFFPGKM